MTWKFKFSLALDQKSKLSFSVTTPEEMGQWITGLVKSQKAHNWKCKLLCNIQLNLRSISLFVFFSTPIGPCGFLHIKRLSPRQVWAYYCFSQTEAVTNGHQYLNKRCRTTPTRNHICTRSLEVIENCMGVWL